MDGARGYRKVNQGSTEMMSTEHASATKWRREREERSAGERMWRREIYGKRKLEREREGGREGGGVGEYVMKERRAFSEENETGDG